MKAPHSSRFALYSTVPRFLYIFGYETPRQRHNNATQGWDDEDSHGVIITASDAGSALAWGDRIAQRYVAQLHGIPEVDWSVVGYASFIEREIGTFQGPCVQVSEYPDFAEWLEKDRT